MAKSAALARAKPFAHRRSCRLTLVPDGKRSTGQGMSGRPSHRNDATQGRSWRRIWSGIASSGADIVLIILASSFSRQTAKGRPVLALPVRSLYRLTCSRLDVMHRCHAMGAPTDQKVYLSALDGNTSLGARYPSTFGCFILRCHPRGYIPHGCPQSSSHGPHGGGRTVRAVTA